MVGITLSPEQVRAAPPEVRCWLENQIAATLGLQPHPVALDTVPPTFVSCGPEDARKVLALIWAMLPVTHVFLDLGRESAVLTSHGMRLLHLDDMVRQCRLRSPDDIVKCLETINEAFRRVTDDPRAVLAAPDNAGHCLVPDATARAIQSVWQDLSSRRSPIPVQPAPGDLTDLSQSFQTPFAVSVPPRQ